MSFQHMDHAEYSKHSKFQNSAVGRALDSGVVDRAVSGLIQTLEREGGNQSRTIRIAEYGSADGCNSVCILDKILSDIRLAFPRSNIEIVSIDLPGTNWDSLFMNLKPLAAKHRGNISFLSRAGSFYDQLLPCGSVDLGFCCTAIHWLSRAPCYQDSFAYMADPEAPEYVKEAWERQSRRDLNTFYSHRCQELRPGALFYLLSMGNDSPMSQRRIDGLINYRGWNANLKRALDKRGLLRPEEVAMKFVVPCYSARQAADLVPQEDAGVRLNLLESQDFDVGVPDLMKARAQEDWSSYFGTLRKMMGGYLDPTYRNALRQIGVESESEIDGIIEDIYSSCLGGIVRDPKKNSTHWCYTSILLQKMCL